MPVSATPQYIAFAVESAFVTGAPASWPLNGTAFYCIEPDKSGLLQAVLDNENNRIRPRANHQGILGLRNSNITFGLYMHGSPTNASEGQAATAYHVSTLLQAALGGIKLGYSAAVVSSGEEGEDEVEISADPGFEVGDFVFYKPSGGPGEFYRILDIGGGGDDPIVLTIDRDCHVAVADRSEDDTLRAVIDVYIDAEVTTDHTNASHKTLQVLMQGDHAEDIDICAGVKPQVSIEPITAGEATRLNFDCLVTTFKSADEETKKDFSSATIVGEAGIVPGVSASTFVKMATFGDPLATVRAIGSVTCEPGVVYERVMGVTDHGVHGHCDTLEDTTLELAVEFDKDYKTEFRAKAFKQALIQIGHDSAAWGVYYPKLSYTAEPTPGAENGIRTSSLSFRAHENTASSALTGDDLRRWQSAMHILLVA